MERIDVSWRNTGAGFAGMTASAALSELGIAVTLYEAQTAALHFQLNCATRYIHPHIYDWPVKNIDDIKANLPVLDWQAGPSNNVAQQVQMLWDAKYADKVTVHLGQKVTNVKASHQKWQIVTETGGEQSETYDFIILSVGFGVEAANDEYSMPYWGDIPLSTVAVQDQTWLVSGAGDGALTDVMRLCIQHTNHEGALRQVVQVLHRLDKDWLEKFRDKANANNTGTAMFDGIDAVQATRTLKLNRTKVTLNATEDEVFGSDTVAPRASILNRLITVTR